MSMLQALIAAKMAGGSGGGSATEKTLAQRGFITHPSSIYSLSGTAPDYYISVSQTVIVGDLESYVPEAGSLLIVRAPSSGVSQNATLKFRLSTKYSASWPIYYDGTAITDNVVRGREIMLLSFNGSRYYVAGVVRDPVTVPTKLSDLQNDLDLQAIQKITLDTNMQASLGQLLAATKSQISGSSGEAAIISQTNMMNLVSVVFHVLNQGNVPVIELTIGNRITVTDTGFEDDGADGLGWVCGTYHEYALENGVMYGYSHEIVLSCDGCFVHTRKYTVAIAGD